MRWDDLVKLTKLLNNQEYKEAVEFFSKLDWDDMAISVFVYGFDLTKCELLIPIKDRICSVKTEDLRVAIRLSLIEETLNKSEYSK